jgi:hypothetical protein
MLICFAAGIAVDVRDRLTTAHYDSLTVDDIARVVPWKYHQDKKQLSTPLIAAVVSVPFLDRTS